MSTKRLLSLLCLLAATATAAAAPSIRLLYSVVVNDTIPDAHSCSGLAIAPNGDYLCSFCDKGDGGPGAAGRMVRSTDQGRTWGAPELCIASESKKEGVTISVFNYPDGTLAMEKARIQYDYEDEHKAVYEGNRNTITELYISKDNGKSFQFLQTLAKPDGALLASMSTIHVLPNGDWILPAYVYPYAKNDPAFPYGSGFFRSTDKGKTWGKFERAFTELPEADKLFRFNESAFAVRDDGTIVGFARIDTRPMMECTQFRILSTDNGHTWSLPEDTKRICGDFPRIVKLDDNQGFLMVCGYRAAKPVLGTVTFFHSPDGLEFKEIGRAFYQPDNRHVPANSATGGIQSIIHGPKKNQFFVVFYAHDPKLPGKMKLRVEANMIEFVP